MRSVGSTTRLGGKITGTGQKKEKETKANNSEGHQQTRNQLMSAPPPSLSMFKGKYCCWCCCSIFSFQQRPMCQLLFVKQGVASDGIKKRLTKVNVDGRLKLGFNVDVVVDLNTLE